MGWPRNRLQPGKLTSPKSAIASVLLQFRGRLDTNFWAVMSEMPARMPATRVWCFPLHQAMRRKCCMPDVIAFVFRGSRSSCLLYLYQARSSTLLMVSLEAVESLSV